MTLNNFYFLLGCAMLGMAFAKKGVNQQDKYIKIALYTFGAGFIIACIFWN
jgi:hypothetical protein